MVVVADWVTVCLYPAVSEYFSVSLSASGIPTVIENSMAMVIVSSSAFVVTLECDFVKPTVYVNVSSS